MITWKCAPLWKIRLSLSHLFYVSKLFRHLYKRRIFPRLFPRNTTKNNKNTYTSQICFTLSHCDTCPLFSAFCLRSNPELGYSNMCQNFSILTEKIFQQTEWNKNENKREKKEHKNTKNKEGWKKIGRIPTQNKWNIFCWAHVVKSKLNVPKTDISHWRQRTSHLKAGGAREKEIQQHMTGNEW